MIKALETPMPNAQFVTTDFGVATYLFSDSRVQLVATQALSPTRVQFVMTPKAVCDDLANLYFSDRAMVNPRVLHDRARHLKNVLHAVRRGEHP